MQEHMGQSSSAPPSCKQREVTRSKARSSSWHGRIGTGAFRFQTITGLAQRTRKQRKTPRVQAFPSMWVTKLGTIQKKRLPREQCKEFFLINTKQFWQQWNAVKHIFRFLHFHHLCPRTDRCFSPVQLCVNMDLSNIRAAWFGTDK